MAKIFLSYSRRDTAVTDDFISRIQNHLREASNIEPWIDKDLPIGSNWLEEIEKHLDSAEVFILVLSPEYVASEYCNFEMGVALSKRSQGKARVVPVLLSDVEFEGLPPQLRHRTLLDARDKSAEQVAELLANIVGEGDRGRGNRGRTTYSRCFMLYF
jgi:hypothetical protein